jgi:formate dehydrogenase iron-sulfur subunit
MDRRNFLKTLGAAAAGSALVTAEATASPRSTRRDAGDRFGILIDTTFCAGCHSCSVACSEAHELPEADCDDATVRDTNDRQWSIINRFETSGGEFFVKRQCMHCLEPACVAACLTEAMELKPDGAVVWNEDRCMGCRYCMISCPFDVPKFEYGSANPKIQKCRRCWEETQEGAAPACVDACPMGALQFGRRSELLAEAHKRISQHPNQYVDHIYGESEVGGTTMLYLAGVPFEELGFRTDLGDRSYPEYTKEFLYAVPFVLTAVPAFLLAVSRAVSKPHAAEAPAPATPAFEEA